MQSSSLHSLPVYTSMEQYEYDKSEKWKQTGREWNEEAKWTIKLRNMQNNLTLEIKFEL